MPHWALLQRSHALKPRIFEQFHWHLDCSLSQGMRVAARNAVIAASLCEALACAPGKQPTEWVLLRPSIDAEGARLSDPVAEWYEVGRFRSARGCVEELVLLRTLIYDREEDAKPAERATWWAVANAVEAARCVPAKQVDRERDEPERPLRPDRERLRIWTWAVLSALSMMG